MKSKGIVPMVAIRAGKFHCPECEKGFPSKASYSMHYVRKHYMPRKGITNQRKRIYRRKEPTNDSISYCPECGAPLAAYQFARQTILRHA